MKIFLLLILFSTSTLARTRYLGRSSQGLLMGDAFTAIADDASTLFYNPAAMARHTGVSLSIVNPHVQVPNALNSDFSLSNVNFGLDERFENWPSTAEGVADRILGYPLYIQLSAAPTIKMQHFAFTMFANSKTTLAIENAYFPVMEIDYRLDRGFIIGGGFSLAGNAKSGSQTSMGFSVKSVNRQGLQNNFSLFSTELLQVIDSSDNWKSIRSNLGYSKGSAFGFDIGFEQVFRSSINEIILGLSILDVAGMKFEKDEGNSDIPEQEMTVNFGSSLTQDLKIFDHTIAIDLHNLVESQASFGSKVHLGWRFRLPFFQFFTGWNGGYVSTGVSLNILMFEVVAGFYGIETGYEFKEREGKRAVVELKLIDYHFDL